MRAAIYARVSTFDQEPENQLAELRRYVKARGWIGKDTSTAAFLARRIGVLGSTP
jgi:DNA invertase Pin-like site-specific DNA recombinase